MNHRLFGDDASNANKISSTEGWAIVKKEHPDQYRAPVLDRRIGQGGIWGRNLKNKGNSGKPDKGSNSPEYENTCPSKSSSNEQKPEITHGEHLRGEVRPKKISSIIDADPGLIRLAEEACKNQRVQDNINHLQDELAKGNDNPGIHKKYLGNITISFAQFYSVFILGRGPIKGEWFLGVKHLHKPASTSLTHSISYSGV